MRITEIEINNFKAFYGTYNIDLTNDGKNLLIYGENGSGKSSLFTALRQFFNSSQNNINLDDYDNIYVTEPHRGQNYVKIKFRDTSSTTSTPNDYEFSRTGLNTQGTFIVESNKTKAFLDYKKLYKAHTSRNVFDLVIEVLSDAINPITNNTFITDYNFIHTNIKEHHWSLGYLDAQQRINDFNSGFGQILIEITPKVNELVDYFNYGVNIKFRFPGLTFRSKTIYNEDLFLEIKYNNQPIKDYESFLNEARLTAISTSIFLAAILNFPKALLKHKILFLDDILIGLDMSNRLPLLEIMVQEFNDWQVFITTFDRHFFEITKLKLETEIPKKWKSIELYSGVQENVPPFNFPILVEGESNYEKGTYYLHHNIKPEYPAAANYFRKTLEEIILNYLPVYERVNIENKLQILDYKLGPLLSKTKRFFEKTGNNPDIINKILSFLPALLHPLSHYEVTSPVYKGELIKIENLIPKLIGELKTLDIPNNYKCSPLEGNTLVRIKYTIDSVTGHFSFYELRTTEPLLLINDPSGNPLLSEVHCTTEKCWGEKNGTRVAGSRKEFNQVEKTLPEHNHISLLDAYDKIHSKIIQNPAIGNFPKDSNYLDALTYLDQQGVYQPLNSIIIW